MRDRGLLGLAITTISVMSAVGVLVMLLLIATSRAPDQLRQVGAHTEYLKQAVISIGRGIEVSIAQHEALDANVDRLDLALGEGVFALSNGVTDTYQPATVLQASMETMHIYVKDPNQGKRIEIQIRSLEHHNWSTLVEITDLLLF